MAAGCRLGMATIALAVLAVALAGCAETLRLAELPNVTRLPEKLLSKEEQQKTVNQMAEKAQTQQAGAAKEIEKTGKSE